MSSKLPKSWITANLFDICTPTQWKTISIGELSDSGYPVYGANGRIGFYSEYTHEHPTIMITCRGATCGNIHISVPFSYINGNAMALDGLNEKFCELKYLAHFLSVRKFDDVISGSAQPQITRASLSPVQFPLAPRAEQTRIVAKIEELLSDLDAGVAELKAAQKKLGQYRQSLLKAAVEGDDSGFAFPKLTLGELVKSIGQGWSPKCKPEAATNDEQWAVMKTTAIQTLDFDGAHNKVLPTDLKPRQHLELKSGDLLVTRAGPRNRVGISCLVRSTRPKLILCDKAYRIRCDETLINPEFLELVLNAPHIVQRIDELKTGISDSGLNLTQDRFFTLEIPIPSLEVQQLIIEKVQIQVESIRNQEKSIEHSLKQSAAQRQNILRAAFAGQLVPQDPTDEPASELLERIRAERTEKAAVKKPRGRKTKEPT